VEGRGLREQGGDGQQEKKEIPDHGWGSERLIFDDIT
jgi:hypothetical protein